MNQRIEQLAVRAGATLEKGYIELSDGQFMLSDNIDLDKTNLDLEKFAELIVKECRNAISELDVDSPEATIALLMADGAIRSRFGIEQ